MINADKLQPGIWVELEKNNPVAFGVAGVELAIKYGYDILPDVWAEDKPVFLSGAATEEMLEDLSVIADFGIQYLADQLPEGYEFSFTDEGLVLDERH
jgi:cytochrome c-type biogenesis protein CcmE